MRTDTVVTMLAPVAIHAQNLDIYIVFAFKKSLVVIVAIIIRPSSKLTTMFRAIV